MFQFRRFPSIRYGLAYGCMRYAHTGFPIQRSADQWIFAPPRSFSQLITSFIGSQCQGIHPALFFAWPVCCFNSVWNRVCFLKKLFQLLNNYVYVWFANFRLLFSDVLIKISQIFFLNTYLYEVFKVQIWLNLYQSLENSNLLNPLITGKTSMFLFWSGSHLLSHTVSSIVSSAAFVLTIVFGMWTGVSQKRIATRNVLLSSW